MVYLAQTLTRKGALMLLLLLGTSANKTECERRKIVETGYEVFKRNGEPKEVDMRIDTIVNKTDCSYQITATFDGNKMDELGIPFMNDVAGPFNGTRPGTGPNFYTSNRTEFDRICLADGRNELDPYPGFLPDSVGDNEIYTSFGWTMKVPEKTAEASGFKEITIDATPCGNVLQPFPHYNFHFYTVATLFRRSMVCNSKGGFFCKDITQQCSDAGRNFQMDGVGIPRCEGGPYAGQYANVPPTFQWTIDGNPAIGANAATPAMGLHGVLPEEFAPTKPQNEPFLLLVQYGSSVISNHIVVWSGFATGKTPSNSWEKLTPEYTCLDWEHRSLPWRSALDYNPRTGLTSITISGPAKKCEQTFKESTGKGNGNGV